MPRAVEVLDQTERQLERGEASALEVIDALFAEELTLRENRRTRMALRMAKLSTIKTLAGFDFSFQPSLERNRILAWAWRPVAASILQALPTSSALSPRPNGWGKIACGHCPPAVRSTIRSAS
jgi:hypothetical protein